MWPMLLLIGGIVLAMGLPIIFMVSIFQHEEEQRKKVGRCHFVE